MAENQHEPNANELWLYFQNVINWIKVLFPTYRKEMNGGIEWGALYNDFHKEKFDAKVLETKISELMQDEDVSNKKGAYIYAISGQEKFLNIRTFTDKQKREAYERQEGICSKCERNFLLEEMEADHITPWSQGGKTNADNCQMLCRTCNRTKSDK